MCVVVVVFCSSSSIAAFKTMNTKQRPLQKNSKRPLQETEVPMFNIYEFCRSGIPLKSFHNDKSGKYGAL